MFQKNFHEWDELFHTFFKRVKRTKWKEQSTGKEDENLAWLSPVNTVQEQRVNER